MDKFEIVNYFDTDELVAEVYYSSFQWAKIFRKNKQLAMQLYSHPNKGSWEFSFKEALMALEEAKNKLLKKLITNQQYRQYSKSSGCSIEHRKWDPNKREWNLFSYPTVHFFWGQRTT